MRIKSQWKQIGKKTVYNGHYRMVEGEREFILVNTTKPRDRVIPFNSHEAAKQAGWRKKRVRVVRRKVRRRKS